MVILALLGFNKQLDIQTLFTEIGRNIARSEGWYDQRDTVQILFIASLASVAIIAALTMFWSFRKLAGAVQIASIGLSFIIAFVVVRAASFHHVDMFLGNELGGLRWNGILELGGIMVIASAALVYQKKRKY